MSYAAMREKWGPLYLPYLIKHLITLESVATECMKKSEEKTILSQLEVEAG